MASLSPRAAQQYDFSFSLLERYDFPLSEEEEAVVEPLERAAFLGRSEKLKEGFKLGRWDEKKRERLLSCLWYASYGGRLETVQLLCGYCTEEKQLTKNHPRWGTSPLQAAAMKTQAVVLDYFLTEQKLDVNGRDREGRTPLHLLLIKGDGIRQDRVESMAKCLLQLGAFPKLPDKEGNIPEELLWNKIWEEVEIPSNWKRDLFQSIEIGDKDAFSQGLQDLKESSQSCYDAVGYHPLHRIVFSPIPDGKKVAMIRELASVVPGMVNARDHKLSECLLGKSRKENQRTALHYAAEEGKEELVKVLLEVGANPNCSDDFGIGPLYLASTPQIVHLLCDKGADPNQKDGFELTPLHVAVQRGLPFVAQALLQRGSHLIQERSSKEEVIATPLHCARSVECVKVLLECAKEKGNSSVVLNAQDESGRTPLHAAIHSLLYKESNAFPVALELLAWKPDLSLKEEKGYTPLAFAEQTLKMAKQMKGSEQIVANLERIIQMLEARKSKSSSWFW